MTVEKTASLIQEEVGGDLYSINEDQDDDFSTYEFIVLGFLTENNELPDEIENFLSKYDFGAKTIFPDVYKRQIYCIANNGS